VAATIERRPLRRLAVRGLGREQPTLSTYRSVARRLDNCYRTATPDTIFRHFIATPGELHVTDDGIDVRLRPRTHTPVLLDAGYQHRSIEVPWWNGRRLSYSFPPPDTPHPTKVGSKECRRSRSVSRS
jgi:hypothetical protein